MKFVFAFVALATVASAELEYFKGNLSDIKVSIKDIEIARVEILKKEKQLGTMVNSTSVILAAEDVLQAAASTANIKNAWKGVNVDEGPITSGKPNDNLVVVNLHAFNRISSTLALLHIFLYIPHR